LRFWDGSRGPVLYTKKEKKPGSSLKGKEGEASDSTVAGEEKTQPAAFL